MSAPVSSSSHVQPRRSGRATARGHGCVVVERPGLASSVQFAGAARSLAAVARARGLVVPGFRSPPRVAGAERTLRRTRHGAPTVAVRLRGRPFAAVVADMVEGVVVVNGLVGAEATRVRTALWEGVSADASFDAQAA